MIIYLSGIHYETDLKFISCLKEQFTGMGLTVVVPEENELTRFGWAEKLAKRMRLILTSETIYMLPNWKDSTIARIELTVAMNERKYLCFTIDDIKDLLTTLDG